MLTHGNIAEYRGTMFMEVTVKSGNFLVCLQKKSPLRAEEKVEK